MLSAVGVFHWDHSVNKQIFHNLFLNYDLCQILELAFSYPVCYFYTRLVFVWYLFVFVYDEYKTNNYKAYREIMLNLYLI